MHLGFENKKHNMVLADSALCKTIQALCKTNQTLCEQLVSMAHGARKGASSGAPSSEPHEPCLQPTWPASP